VLFVSGAAAQDRPKVEIVLNLPHRNEITGLAFSPDGTRALSGSSLRGRRLSSFNDVFTANGHGNLSFVVRGSMRPIAS
jgi:WD40 repeat protein